MAEKGCESFTTSNAFPKFLLIIMKNILNLGKWASLCVGALIFGCQTKEQLFLLHNSAQTGITFSNNLYETDSLNVLTFEYMYNGAGVGIGDFNRDGLVDIYFAGNQVSSRLYVNNGDFQFADVTESSGTATSAWCTGVSVADVNQDGWLDIYVSVAGPDPDSTKRANKLFINDGRTASGRLTFTESAVEFGLNDMGYSSQAAFLDYDRDGDLDCYVLTNALEPGNRNALRPKRLHGEGPSNDRLYRNDGWIDGAKSPHFTNVSASAGILAEGYGLGICISDLDDDGWPDVYCANDFLSNDLVWMNQPGKQTTFSDRAADLLKHQTHNGMGVDIADINNDALPDIVVLDMLPEGNYRQKMMLPGSNYNRFQMERELGYQPQYMRNTLQLNRGLVQKDSLPSFSEIGQLAGIEKTDWSWAPLLADFDNDGWKDLYITNGYRRDVTNLDFIAFNHQDASFGTPQARAKKAREELNNLAEIKIAKYAYRNRGGEKDGQLTFEDVSADWGLDQLGYSNGAAYADLDNDGDLDLVTNNIDSEPFVLENRLNQLKNKSGEVRPHWLRLRIEPAPGLPVTFGTKVLMYAGNKLQMQELCPVRGFVSTVENTIHFGMGSTETYDSLVIRYPNGKKQVVASGKADRLLSIPYQPAGSWKKPDIYPTPLFSEIPFAQSGLDVVHKETPVVDFNRTPLLPHQYSRNGPSIAVGDVNGDHLDDFFMGNDYGQSSRIYIQNKNGRFIVLPLRGSSFFEDMGASFFDADGDGDQDLYIVSGGSRVEGLSTAYQDRLYLNKGIDTSTQLPRFEEQKNALPVTLSSGSCIVTNDFDGDGDQDIFRGGRVIPGQYPKAADSYLLRNDSNRKHGPRFTDVTDQLAPELRKIGMVTAAQWSDIDNDHKADLFLVGEWMPPTLFINRGGKLARKLSRGLADTPGWWCSLLAHDFDGDGDQDFVAGNLGLNSKYKATSAEPVEIFASDFDQNGRLDPILTFYLDHQQVVAAQRDVVMAQIPSIKKRFTTYHDFASRTFVEQFTEEERKAAFHAQAKQMASCYIENKGNADFKVHKLPVEAQIAPVYGIHAADFTGDGLADLLVAGNFFGAETMGGHYDAGKGLLMAGDGKGGFKAISNTGLMLDKDAKALEPLHRPDGSLWWLVANNNASLQIWRQNKKPINRKNPFASH